MEEEEVTCWRDTSKKVWTEIWNVKRRRDEMVRRQILITFFRDIGYRGENFEMTMTNGLEIRDRIMRF